LQSAAEPPRKISEGERAVQADGNDYSLELYKSQGRPVEAVYASEGTPQIVVETGIFRGTGVRLLATILRERFLEGQVAVTQASEEDLQYYWLMIPYDIEEPVLRLDTPAGSLLLDVEDDGRVTWIDLLPRE